MVDELEPLINAGGGLILDWHTCDAFPERWIDLVVVLQCNHTRLWDRLEARCVVNHYRHTDHRIHRFSYLEVTH